MKRGYSYIRFSARHQMKGRSLNRQYEATVAWCERNGVKLDTSLVLRDLGVSALHGDNHRGNPDRYALACFLAECEAGRVPPDSYLIIENLDRLSREHYRPAFSLFNSILDRKVNIVTTTPERVFRHDSTDPTDSIIAIVELSRGNSESVIKSKRVGDAWRRRKKAAVESKAPVTASCPKWLKLVDGKYQTIPERVRVVRQIYRWCIDGHGIGVIATKLNDESVEPFGERGEEHAHKDKPRIWQKSSVARILGNRAVLGEYQPGEGTKRKPVPGVGPITDYYPRIIDDSEFVKAQAAMKNRAHRRGDKRQQSRNLFTGLLMDVKGKPYNYHGSTQTSSHGSYEYVVPSDAHLSSKAYIAFPYPALERAVLGNLGEIKPADLTTGEETKLAERMGELSGLIEQAKAKVSTFEDRIYEEPLNDTWPRLLKKAKEEVEGLAKEHEELRLSLSSPVVEGVSEAQTLIQAIADPEKRTKLKAKLASLVKSIGLHVWEDVIDEVKVKAAWAQIHFKHSRHVRNVVLSYTTGYGKIRPAKVHVYAVGDSTLEDLQFNEDNAVEVERCFGRDEIGKGKEV